LKLGMYASLAVLTNKNIWFLGTPKCQSLFYLGIDIGAIRVKFVTLDCGTFLPVYAAQEYQATYAT